MVWHGFNSEAEKLKGSSIFGKDATYYAVGVLCGQVDELIRILKQATQKENPRVRKYRRGKR